MSDKSTFSRNATAERIKIAYMMSRFPKITETFILFEMLAIEEQGVDIEIYPLLREKYSVIHPEAEEFVSRANFTPFISLPIMGSHLYYLLRKPAVYFKTLWTLVRANWGSRRYLFAALVYFPKLVHIARRMQETGIEHLHAHFASHPAMGAYVIHQLTEIPYSFTAHGSDLHRDQHMLCEKVKDAVFVVPISNYNREMLINKCGKQVSDKLIVIHCGVNLKIFSAEMYSEAKIKDKGLFTILCVGTLHEVKGQRYLIEACKELKDKGAKFSCEFIGDGEDEEMLKQLSKEMGLEEQTVFYGRLNQAQVVERMQMADVLVQPSVPSSDGRQEGIPVVLMEGMSSGIPVISSRLSGIPELVEDGVSGILTKPGDVEAIANALALYYNDPNVRRQFGTAGRDKVKAEFDLNKNTQILLAHLRIGR